MTIMLEAVTTYRDFLQMGDTWNTLLSKSDNNCVFLTWEWLSSWWKVFGNDKELLILRGYTEDRTLAGIAPLMIRTRRNMGLKVRSVEFISSGDEVTPDQLGFITLQPYKAEFVRAVLRYLEEKVSWEMIKWGDMLEDRDMVKHIRTAQNRSYLGRIRTNGICPYITLPAAWETYLEKISATNRSNIARKERAINKIYAISFDLHRDRDSLDDVLRKLEELHRKRMGEQKKAGSSLKRPFWEFHRLIAHAFLEKGWLFIGILKANDAIAACQYGFRYNGKVSFYQSGIDPAFHRYSVGMLSTAGMIRSSIEQKATEYDFLRGAENYKFQWTKQFRKNTEIILWNRTWKAILPFLLFSIRGYAGAVVRKSAFLNSIYQRVSELW